LSDEAIERAIERVARPSFLFPQQPQRPQAGAIPADRRPAE
jgi:hypothetical protein